MKNDINILNDKKIASLINNLVKLIDEVKVKLSANDNIILKTQISQSYNYYGYYLYLKNNNMVWFGYSFELWETYGNLFILEINKEWIKNKNNEFDDYLKNEYKYNEKWKYFKSYGLNLFLNKEELIIKIEEDLIYINNL